MQTKTPLCVTRSSFCATRELAPPTADGPDQRDSSHGNILPPSARSPAETSAPSRAESSPEPVEPRKAVLICPAERPGVIALAELAPLAVLPLLGKRLIEYWLEHLFQQGVREVRVLVTDRPEQVRAVVGDGSRWGLRIEVLPEAHELTPDEARAKHCAGGGEAVLLDRLPGQPGKVLFSSYAAWFTGVLHGMSAAAASARIGLREVKPGVWVGLRTRISPRAELRPPCWIGNFVHIGPEAVIGPMAVVENRSFVEAGAEVAHGIVGPDTYVGQWSEVQDSLVAGNQLINWRTGSCVSVPDAFQLCAMTRPRGVARAAGVLGRLAALLALVLTAPAAGWAVAKARWRGRPALRRVVAVRPQSGGTTVPAGELICHELTEAGGLLRRWPQLWNVVRGEFAWVGNRPLPPAAAADLLHDFERLWLAAPAGLVSLADAEGCPDPFGDEARAHASYYAVRRNWRLDMSILARVLTAAVAAVPRLLQREDSFLTFREPVTK